MHQSYLEDCTRKEIIQTIQQQTGLHLGTHTNGGGRRYAQYLENARYNLAEMLWQNEVATRV